MEDSRSSDDELSRRFRNRAIECLELVESQVIDTNGMINWWDDWRDALLGPPPASSLSNEELEALLMFDRAWNEFVAATPNPAPPISELDDTSWQAFHAAAARALLVFNKVGRSPEEEFVA